MTTEKHPSFSHPQDPRIKIWRYMDLAKFVSLLQEGALHFCRADRLGDPFEGSVPLRNSGEFLKAEVAKHPELAKQMAPGVEALNLEQLAEMRFLLAKGRRELLPSFYCNCWHMNDHESAAMWRLYCQASEAICIQSTFEKLDAELPTWTFLGKVTYIDYQRDAIDEGNAFNPVMTKRKSYEHEREVRAIAWSRASAETGGDAVAKATDGEIVRVPVNLNGLIEAVYVSPASPKWFRKVVDGLLNKFELPITATQSALDAEPLF